MMHLSHFFSVFFVCVQKFVHTQVPATVTVGVVACLFKKLLHNYTENLSPRLYRNIFSYIINFGRLDTMFAILFFLNVII